MTATPDLHRFAADVAAFLTATTGVPYGAEEAPAVPPAVPYGIVYLAGPGLYWGDLDNPQAGADLTLTVHHAGRSPEHARAVAAKAERAWVERDAGGNYVAPMVARDVEVLERATLAGEYGPPAAAGSPTPDDPTGTVWDVVTGLTARISA